MCVLRVSGEEFDPEPFLASSSFSPMRVFHRGEPAALRDRAHLKASGFVQAVSDRPWSDLPGQIEDSVAFLRKHRDELLRLAADPTVSDMRLDFASTGKESSRSSTTCPPICLPRPVRSKSGSSCLFTRRRGTAVTVLDKHGVAAAGIAHQC